MQDGLRNKLGLCVCYTQLGEGHCVLWVDTDKGPFILDNNYAFPVKPNELPYKWVYVMRWCLAAITWFCLTVCTTVKPNNTSLFLVKHIFIIISGLIIANETHKT